MPISTKDYLTEKKSLEESITWYVKTISETDRQNQIRKVNLEDLVAKLNKLEEEYSIG